MRSGREEGGSTRQRDEEGGGEVMEMKSEGVSVVQKH